MIFTSAAYLYSLAARAVDQEYKYVYIYIYIYIFIYIYVYMYTFEKIYMLRPDGKRTLNSKV
jgi:hypothetical protein